MRRIMLLTALALTGSLLFASVAEAHKLRSPQAKQASNAQTRALCASIPECFSWGTSKPERQTRHKVLVASSTSNFDGRNTFATCAWMDQWRIRQNSRRLRYNFRLFDRTLDCQATRVSSASASAADRDAAAELEREVRAAVRASR